MANSFLEKKRHKHKLHNIEFNSESRLLVVIMNNLKIAFPCFVPHATVKPYQKVLKPGPSTPRNSLIVASQQSVKQKK